MLSSSLKKFSSRCIQRLSGQFRLSKQMSFLRTTAINHSLPKSSFLTQRIYYRMSSQYQHHKNLFRSTYEGNGFQIQQLFAGCLAIYSYYIESGDECFLVDPILDIQEYAELISERKKTLKGIFLTHYHADYVSGQAQLVKIFGCKVYMGPKSISNQIVYSMKDRQQIKLGKVNLQCWHTPGHTEESSCLVLNDSNGKKDLVFTGDTLFLNEVGRPDLAVKTNLKVQDLANLLYDSVQKLKTLPDDIRIYPGHGAGSSCGKSIGAGDFCTMDKQKVNNYGLVQTNRSEFIKKVIEQLPKPPQYFGYNARINKFQPFFSDQINKSYEKLSPQRLHQLTQKQKVVIIDVRPTDQLKDGIIKNSICIGFNGGFANWVGTLFDPKDQIILFGTDQQAQLSIKRLLRIGYINIIGIANFPIKVWKDKNLPTAASSFYEQLPQPGTTILDVRKAGEWKDNGVAEGAITYTLEDVFKNPQKLDKNKHYITHCAGGYRSLIAWSFLISHGFKASAFTRSFPAIFENPNIKKVAYKK